MGRLVSIGSLDRRGHALILAYSARQDL